MFKNLVRFSIFILIIPIVFACKRSNQNYQKDAAQAELIHRSVRKLTDVIMYDIFNPPQASRIYSYACVAGYEAMHYGTPGYKSLVGQLKDLKSLPQPETDKEYCFPVAGIHAFLRTGKELTFSPDTIDAFEKEIMAQFESIGVPEDVMQRSIAFGDTISKQVKAWSDGDNYKQSRTFPKYTLTKDPSKWQLTRPDYMDAVEPHWRTIRPMAMDSAAQFKPAPPTPFSTDKKSQFYKEAFEVYQTVKDSSVEKMAIANHWDCNPFATVHEGHFTAANKKITPGGHWMNLTAIAARQQKTDLIHSMEAYLLVSIGLRDGFISCWDEKYRSQLVRPITYINENIDKEWNPLLQTPPFPEHTSGHSVVSGASSEILSTIFGENIAFDDDTEVIFGMPIRHFKSFRQAAEEAAVSRLYGGIHYRPAIEVGLLQGQNVAKNVLQKVKTK